MRTASAGSASSRDGSTSVRSGSKRWSPAFTGIHDPLAGPLSSFEESHETSDQNLSSRTPPVTVLLNGHAMPGGLASDNVPPPHNLESFKGQVEQILLQAAQDIDRGFRSALWHQEQTIFDRMVSMGVNPGELPTQDSGHDVTQTMSRDEIIVDVDMAVENERGNGNGIFVRDPQERSMDISLHGPEVATPPYHLTSSRKMLASIGSRDGSVVGNRTDIDMDEDQFGLSGTEVSTVFGESDAMRAKFRANGKRKRTFRLLDEWADNFEEITEMDEQHFARIQYHAGLSLMLNKADDHTSKLLQTSAQMAPSGCVMSPQARPRIAWDLMAAVFLAYDLCLIPMAVFDIPRSGFLFVMSCIVMFYWTVDIVANFFVGYARGDGEVETRLRPVAIQYCRTWLPIDLVIVTLDWIMYGEALFTNNTGTSGLEGAGLVRVGKFARFLRTMRVLRLLRFGKMRLIISRIHDQLGHESTAIVFSIWRNLLVILLMNHFLACVWFWIGLQNEDSGWLSSTPNGRKSDFWLDNYLIALYWSIANFTPGSSGLQPSTTEEYAFTVVVLFFGLVVFSVFVSSTTSLISRLVVMQSARSKQLWVLRGFLRQHKFTPELRDRVLRYVKTALGHQKSLIHRNDVELLSLLSEPLREEVQLNLHMSTLSAHPLFKILSVASTAVMRKISVDALMETSYSRSDVIFSVGEHLDKMSFIVLGICRYTTVHHSNNDGVTTVLLRSPDSFGEAVLWTRWHSRGTMEADADCTILELKGDTFRKSIVRHHMVRSIVQHYAKAFLEVLNAAASGQMLVPFSDCQSCYVSQDPIIEFLALPWIQQVSRASGSNK
mmetsp:Transcript_48789/g.115969  ORF Transcript_48789/g.115969 Transcript_48789/m.115969 type:complete len:832 (-) Transcript_48789:73-2568(-)